MFLLGNKSRSKDEGEKFMDKMADVLGRVGAWCGQNKYLFAIKNAFQNFMPLTIAGAVGVLWCNVLVNADTGRGMFFKPIMILDFLNPAFQAINFCTISCITVGITLGIAQEIGVWNMIAEKAGYIPGLVGLAAWLSVTNTSHVVKGAKEAFTGIASNELRATGLFTGMIIGILSVELFCFFEKQDALKIKMPDQVPPGVARAFEVLIPATRGLVIAILIFSKRDDNKAIASLSLVPGLFNINETVIFGIPLVLNPILGIPFVITPLINIVIGYILTIIGFCPVACLTVPWTTPPIIFGFLATGASIFGAITQAILIVVSIVIYTPFLISYEKYQNKQATNI